MQAQTWAFLPRASGSGVQAEVLVRHMQPVIPIPALNLVDDEESAVVVRLALQRLEKRGTEVIVAALCLDRFDDDGGHVVGVSVNARSISSNERCSAAATSRSTSAVTGKRSFGFVTRGQLNFGNRSVLTGSVFVSERA